MQYDNNSFYIGTFEKNSNVFVPIIVRITNNFFLVIIAICHDVSSFHGKNNILKT